MKCNFCANEAIDTTKTNLPVCKFCNHFWAEVESNEIPIQAFRHIVNDVEQTRKNKYREAALKIERLLASKAGCIARLSPKTRAALGVVILENAEEIRRLLDGA